MKFYNYIFYPLPSYLTLFFIWIAVFHLHLFSQNSGIWYSEHQIRVDQHRKGDFKLNVIGDGTNSNIQGSINLKLVKHAFPFGTALRFLPNDADEEWYRETAKKYFWYGVIENDFKWASYEYEPDQLNLSVMNEYLDWATESKWELRGHALIWGSEIPNWVNTNDCTELKNKIKNRIIREMNEYKGKFFDYDVWNEHVHVDQHWKQCGTDLLDSAYHWAHQVDPTARLFINEYCAVACNEAQNLDIYDNVKAMLDRGVPVHGIGVQAHFYADYVNAESIRTKLDKLAELGLPIHITEFDVRWQWDVDGHVHTEQSQSDRIALFLRTVFSHPAVEAIVMWGFWDKRYWLENSGFILENKDPKIAADTIYQLWNSIWTTDTNIIIQNENQINFRGYYGTYSYELNINGIQHTGELHFTQDSLEKEIHISGITNLLPKNNQEIKIRVIEPNSITLKSLDFKYDDLYPFQFILFDIKGKSVLNLEINKPNQSLSLKEVPPGLYSYYCSHCKLEKGVFLIQ